MNYLAHYILNHEVRELPREPYFALGVVLPDLWLRFSRTRRIRWKAVRAARPDSAAGQALRAGLLNHVEVDRVFHALPVFRAWQTAARQAAPMSPSNDLPPTLSASDQPQTSPALLEFLAHAAVELAIDHHLLRQRAARVEEFYTLVEQCDPQAIAAEIGLLAEVDTTGLADVVAQFFARRFLRRYAEVQGLRDVLLIILRLGDFPAPPDGTLDALVAAAVREVQCEKLWPALQQALQKE